MCEATGRRGWRMGCTREEKKVVIDEAEAEAEVGAEDRLYKYKYMYVDPM